MHQTIGANRRRLPGELWENIFVQTHALQDALNWADAFDIEARDTDWLRLVRLQCPHLLKDVRTPNVASLWPGHPRALQTPETLPSAASIAALTAPLRAPDLNTSAGISADPVFVPLYEATAFMMRFAQQSPLTWVLLGAAREAWGLRCIDAPHDEAAWRSSVMCIHTARAFALRLPELSLKVGAGARLPYYWQALTSVERVNLFDADDSFDVRTLCTWPKLNAVRLEPGPGAGVCASVTAQVRRLRPDVRIESMPLGAQPLDMPLRYGSESWYAERHRLSVQRSEYMQRRDRSLAQPVSSIVDAATRQQIDDAIAVLRHITGLPPE